MDMTNDMLLDRLFRLEWLLRLQYMSNYHARGPMASTHRGQGRILSLLKIKPEISQKELASILDIRPQSLAELLAKLEKSGYITRHPSEADRRVMEIRLTEEGKLAVREPEEDAQTDDLFDCLDSAEREGFAGYLDRLIEHLEAKFGDDERIRGFHGRPDFHSFSDFMERLGRSRRPGGGGFGFRA